MLKFYICKICGNLVVKIEDGGNTPFCCGRSMSELTPASTDGAVEKHVPVINHNDLTAEEKAIHVAVGSLPHPSENYHFIKWIVLETNKGFHLHYLKAGDTPHTIFMLGDDEDVIKAYAYCNLHGLWIG